MAYVLFRYVLTSRSGGDVSVFLFPYVRSAVLGVDDGVHGQGEEYLSGGKDTIVITRN